MFSRYAKSAESKVPRIPAWIVGLLLVVMAALLVFVLYSTIGRPFEVAHAAARDGTEMLVAQIFLDNVFFSVRFYAKKPNGPWYEYYLEHDANYWRGRIELDEAGTRARVLRDGVEVAVFNWTSGVLEKAPGSSTPLGILQGHPLEPKASRVDSGFPAWGVRQTHHRRVTRSDARQGTNEVYRDGSAMSHCEEAFHADEAILGL